MSVANLRSSFEKKGCQIALWVVMVGTAVGLAGSGFMSCFADQSGLTRVQDLDIELLKVNGQSISLAAVNARVSNRLLGLGVDADPIFEFDALADALENLIQAAVISSLVRSKNVTVSESSAIAMRGQQIDQQIFIFRLQAVAAGDLRPDPTEQEFQDYFLGENGQSASEYKKQALDGFRALLDNPDFRDAILSEFSIGALRLSYVAEATVTDDEVRRSYETLSLEVIYFNDLNMNLGQRLAEAENALAELEGGADFDAVMRKYMDNPVTEPVDNRRSNIESNEQLRPLNDLEPGEISGVLFSFVDEPSIYRLVEVKSELPEDYEDSKEIYADQARREKGAREYDRAVKASRDSATIEWSSAGYEAVYGLNTARNSLELSEDEKEEYFRNVVENDIAMDSGLDGPRPGGLARYAAMVELQRRLNPQERFDMLETHAEVILGVLVFTENVGLRLALVDIYGEREDWAAQAAALLTAAEMNRGIDPINEIYFSQINEKLKLMEDAEQIDEATAGKILQELLAWSEDMADANNDDAAATAIDLEKFNIDPELDFLIGSGDDDDGGTEADDEDEDDSEESGGGDG